MRSSRGRPRGDCFGNVVPTDVEVGLQLLHHQLETVVAVGANLVGFFAQCGVSRVWKIPQQVDTARRGSRLSIDYLGAELNGGNHSHSRTRHRCGCFVPAAQGVVVTEAQNIQTGAQRLLDQLGRGVRPIRAGGVGVEVDS